MDLLIKVAVGFMLLGLGFTIIDFFLGKLLLKMYPNPNCWNEALASPDLSREQRKDLERRKRLYESGVSHRFRKRGIMLVILGALLLAVSICIVHFSR